MAKIQILTTPGCPSCAQVKKMLDGIGVKYEIIDLTMNPNILQKYPIFSAPGIIINGKLEFTGIPSKDDLMKKITKKYK